MRTIAMTTFGDYSKRIPGEVGLLEIPKPELGPEQVLIRIAYASICGSDAYILRANVSEELGNRLKSNMPWRLGHEIAGVIEAVSPEAAAVGLKPGDRVTANFIRYCYSCYYCRTGQEFFCENQRRIYEGMSDYVCWHMSQIHKIPDDVSLLHASQTEPMTISLNAVRTVNVHLGSRVFVSGAGAIGLYAAQLARMAGASLVVVSDVVEKKCKTAVENGADAYVNPLEKDWMEKAMALTGGLGYDAVIECSGANSAAQAMPDIMTPNGHCVMFAMYNPDFELKIKPFFTLYEQAKHIHGMYTSADKYPETIAMLRHMKFDNIIEGVYEPEDCKEAFDKILSGEFMKVCFKFSDDV